MSTLSIKFSESELSDLEEMRKKTGQQSVEVVVHQAVALYKKMLDKKKEINTKESENLEDDIELGVFHYLTD